MKAKIVVVGSEFVKRNLIIEIDTPEAEELMMRLFSHVKIDALDVQTAAMEIYNMLMLKGNRGIYNLPSGGIDTETK